jgi:hypothetical protein
MIETTPCAKCGGHAVCAIDDLGRRIGNQIPIGLFSAVKVEHHVCTTCGHVETYITDKETLAKIAEKWGGGH